MPGIEAPAFSLPLEGRVPSGARRVGSEEVVRGISWRCMLSKSPSPSRPFGSRHLSPTFVGARIGALHHRHACFRIWPLLSGGEDGRPFDRSSFSLRATSRPPVRHASLNRHAGHPRFWTVDGARDAVRGPDLRAHHPAALPSRDRSGTRLPECSVRIRFPAQAGALSPGYWGRG
jgi:hypothetical protein